jgi:hypothetical protein
MALPAQGKTFAQFQQEDLNCRNYAQQVNASGPTQQQVNNAALGSAALGTAVGAGLGAALGSIGGAVGTGAAAGGAAGLLIGGAAAANNTQATAAALQQRYDVAYTQCMYSNGNKVTSAPAGGYYYAPGYYPAYPYYGPAYYGGPVVGFGFGVSSWHGGWHGGWGGWHHW